MKYDNLQNYKCLTRIKGDEDRLVYVMPPQYKYSTFAIDDFIDGEYDFFTMHSITINDEESDPDYTTFYRITLDLCITDNLSHARAPLLDLPNNRFILSDFFKDDYFYEAMRHTKSIYKFIMSAIGGIDLKQVDKGDMFPLKNTICIAAQDSWLHTHTVGDYDTYYITHVAVGRKNVRYYKVSYYDEFIQKVNTEISTLESTIEKLQQDCTCIFDELYNHLTESSIIYKGNTVEVLKADTPYKIQIELNNKETFVDMKFCINNGFITFADDKRKNTIKQYNLILKEMAILHDKLKSADFVKGKATKLYSKEGISDFYKQHGYDSTFEWLSND